MNNKHIKQNILPVLTIIPSIQTYHFDATSVCVIWNEKFPYTLTQTNSKNYAAIESLYRPSLKKTKEIPPERLDLLSEFEAILTESIAHTHCESFIAFEEEIMTFVSSFMKSVLHSKWRSIKNKFLFIQTKDMFKDVSQFNQSFFKDLSDILFVEIQNETVFDLKTTKFVGSRKKHPEQLIFLDRYYGTTNTFEFDNNLYPDKITNMQGRELISAVFSYEPFAILKNATKKNHYMEAGNGNEDPSKSRLYDGTDAQILFQLCRMYNCTVQIDSSKEEEEWGFVYENYTGDGVMGLVFDRKADICMMAMFMWIDIYWKVDMSLPFSTDGIRCLVPVPRLLTSWFLPFQPFQLSLWLGITGCLFLEFLSLLLTRKMEKDENGSHSWKHSFEFGFISSLKLFISQGTDYLTNSTSLRIVLFSCYMIDIIITSVYSGGLSSILTIPAFEEPADTVERLVKQNMIWAGTSHDWILTLKNSKDGIMHQVKELFHVFGGTELKKKSLTERIGLVVERLQWGHVALTSYIDQQIVDRMKLMKEDMYSEHVIAFTSRPWALMEKFNNFILLVQSSGISKYWEWMVVAEHLDEKMQRQIEASAFTNFADTGPVQLGLQNFAGIIVLWIGGTIISILAFLFEIAYYKKTNWFNVKKKY